MVYLFLYLPGPVNYLFTWTHNDGFEKHLKTVTHPKMNDADFFLFIQSMRVKLQPPSGTELAPFNPILPPASITQIMLLANPAKVGDTSATDKPHRPTTGDRNVC